MLHVHTHIPCTIYTIHIGTQEEAAVAAIVPEEFTSPLLEKRRLSALHGIRLAQTLLFTLTAAIQ